MNTVLLAILDNNVENYPHALEQQFPRILDKIMSLWDTPEIDNYFSELMVSKRNNRQGFSAEVASDIIYLSVVHSRQHEPVSMGNPWDELPEHFRQQIEMQGAPFSRKGFIQAVESGNNIAVSLFIGTGLDVDICDERQWTPLMISAFNGNEEVAALLIKAGANLNHRDAAGYTSLHWAAFNGYTEVVSLLLDKGADVNASSAYGWTPLLQAVTRGYLTVSSILLSRGADVNAVSSDGWTALHKAAANGFLQEVILLLSKGADVRAKFADGTTPIDLAKRNKHQQVVLALMAKG